ncbi:MAG: radical SAM protein, partial [Mycobacterium leprae]
SVQTMTLEDLNAFFRSVEAISAMHPSNDVELQLFGGEPLLAETKELVEAVLAYAQHNDYPVSIVSNGSNVNLYLPTFLANKDIISQVAVTLDGPPPIHNRRRIGRKERDTFTTIVNGVDTLLGIGIPVSVGMNLDAQNVDAVPELIKFFIEKGWTEHDSFYIELQAVDDRTLKGNTPHQMLEHDLVRKLQEHWPQISGLADRIDLGAVLMVLPYLASVFGFLDMDKLVIERPVRRFGHYCWVTIDQLTYYFGPDGLIYLCPVALGNPALSVGRFAPHLDLPADVSSRWKDRNMFTMAECTRCRIGPMCGGGCAVTSLLRNPKEMCADCGSSLQVVDGFVSELIVPKLRDQCRQVVR